MSHTGVFRTLLVTSLALAVAGMILDIFTTPLLPPELQSYVEAQAEAEQPFPFLDSLSPLTQLGGFIAVLAMGLLFLGASLVSYVGLFLWQSWARPVSVILSVVGCASYFVLPPMVVWGGVSALYSVSALLYGAVLAMAYCPPLSEKFAKKAAPISGDESPPPLPL